MNPGSLPKDIESIMKEDYTQPRNPIIARVFRVLKLAETAGSGFEKMFAGWEGYHHNTPEIGGDIDFYKITFSTQKETVEKTVEKIIALIKENPRITQEELAASTGLTRRGVEWNIEKLKKEGRLKRVGPAKGGNWELKNESY